MFKLAVRPGNHLAVSGRPVSKPKTFPAPRRGWIRNENLAKSKPEGALILDNWFPTTTGARVRRGMAKYATVGAGARVSVLMPYINGATRMMFAGTDTAIYDISPGVDPNVSPPASVSGLTNSDYAFTLFSNVASIFLMVVNGSDPVQQFDGSTWTVPAITGPTAALSHIWSFKQRLFFVEKNTMNAWYLPIDSLSGAATKLPLGGVFKLGGSLLFGSTWSYDAGSGLAEACIFVTTEGEVAVYEGTDPASATTWSLKGVYRIGRPLGKRAAMKGGGDLAIATDIGLVPLSQALQMDVAALGGRAVSYPIEEEWRAEVLQRRAPFSWSVEMWPTQQMVMVAMPSFPSLAKICFVVNARTGAWARYTGWDVHCMGLLVDRFFFGTANGLVMEAEVGGSDNSAIYTATYVGLFDDMGSPTQWKSAKLAAATFLTTTVTAAKLSVSTDYVAKLPTIPNVGPLPNSSNNWDQGLWEQATWSEEAGKLREQKWQSVTGQGYTLAPNIQISLGSSIAPQIDLVQYDLVFEAGRIGP